MSMQTRMNAVTLSVLTGHASISSHRKRHFGLHIVGLRICVRGRCMCCGKLILAVSWGNKEIFSRDFAIAIPWLQKRPYGGMFCEHCRNV